MQRFLKNRHHLCPSDSFFASGCGDFRVYWSVLLHNITQGEKLLIDALGITALNTTMLHAGVTRLQRCPLSVLTLSDMHKTHTHTPTHTDPERLLSMCIFLVPSHLSKVFGGIVMMMGSPDRDDSSSRQFSLACHRRLTHKCAHTRIHTSERNLGMEKHIGCTNLYQETEP